MDEQLEQIPYEALNFNLEIFFKEKNTHYPCYITRKKMKVSIDNENTLTVSPGDVLIHKEGTFLNLSSDKLGSNSVSKPIQNEVKNEIQNWMNIYWKDFSIQGKEILINLMVNNRIMMQDPTNLSDEYHFRLHDLELDGNKTTVDKFSLKELMRLRKNNIEKWNRVILANQTQKLSKEEIIHEIRKSYVYMEEKTLKAKVRGIRNKMDELTVIADNNNNPIKIIKDLISSEQKKLMSSKQAKKKIEILQKELTAISKQIAIIKTINLDKPNRLDNDLVNEILNKYKDNYNAEVSLIIPGIHPKYSQTIRRVASNLETIENEIDFRLRAYVLAQKTERAHSNELKNEEHSLKL